MVLAAMGWWEFRVDLNPWHAQSVQPDFLLPPFHPDQLGTVDHQSGSSRLPFCLFRFDKFDVKRKLTVTQESRSPIAREERVDRHFDLGGGARNR